MWIKRERERETHTQREGEKEKWGGKTGRDQKKKGKE